jgi:hypothetical protein
MPKASITLENGTIVTIEGSPAEVQELLAFYGSAAPRVGNGKSHKSPTPPAGSPQSSNTTMDKGEEVDLVAIVNYVKSCEEAEGIETRILDQTNQLTRVLLPMYIVYEHMNNAFGLTSGQINKITVQLGVPVKLPNVSKTLAGSAAKHVIGDTVRKSGQAVKYKLSRRGHAYLKEVITGQKNG